MFVYPPCVLWGVTGKLLNLVLWVELFQTGHWIFIYILEEVCWNWDEWQFSNMNTHLRGNGCLLRKLKIKLMDWQSMPTDSNPNRHLKMEVEEHNVPTSHPPVLWCHHRGWKRDSSSSLCLSVIYIVKQCNKIFGEMWGVFSQILCIRGAQIQSSRTTAGPCFLSVQVHTTVTDWWKLLILFPLQLRPE